RLCFLVNVPVGIVALALTPRLVPDHGRERRTRLDLLGTVALAGGLVAILLPLIDGRQSGWPLWTWLSLAAAPVVVAGFALHQLRLQRAGGNPVFDLRLLRNRSFSAGLLTQLALASSQAAFFVYLAIYLQNGRGLSPLAAGLTFAAVAATYVAVSGKATALAQRHGRAVVGAGGAALVLGFLLIAAGVDAVGSSGTVALLVPGLAVAGAGIGLSFTPLTSIVLSGVDPERSGAAAGVLSTTQQIGNAIGVAVTGVIFFARPHDIAGAFSTSLLQLAACSAAIVFLARLLPGGRRA